jgi:hypothetical protein
MNNRLDELLSADHQARWKAILVSGLVAAAVGMVSEAALKRPASDSQTWAAIAGFVAFAVQVLYYCLRSGASVRNSRLERIMRKDAFPLGGSMRAPRRMFVNAAAAAASVLVFVIGTPLVEGAVIDDRLRKLLLIRLFQQTPMGCSQPSTGGSPRSAAPRICSYVVGFCPVSQTE